MMNREINVDKSLESIRAILNKIYFYIVKDFVGDYIDTHINKNPDKYFSLVHWDLMEAFKEPKEDDLKRWINFCRYSKEYLTKTVRLCKYDINTNYNFDEHLKAAYKLSVGEDLTDTLNTIQDYIKLKKLQKKGIKNISSKDLYKIGAEDNTTIADIDREILVIFRV